MKDKQTLFDITTEVLNGMKSILEKVHPDVVLVHGYGNRCIENNRKKGILA